MHTRAKLLYVCATLLSAGVANAALSDEEELAFAYGDKSTVSIATGSALPISRAPAVASVITADDIRAIGATDLDEVLETVPGLHVSRNNLAYSPVYTIRGIRSEFNPQVLMLMNGIPMTSVFLGDRGLIWGGYPVENIARIEVIRGPGSALYGADAFSGVINIVTKSASEIGGTQLGARAGSFKTGDAWLLHGGTLGPVDVAAYLRVGTTEGAREPIFADAQTALDAGFGTNASYASRAEGVTQTGRDALDASIDLGHGNTRVRAGIKERTNVGTGAGVAQAIDPVGTNSNRRINADITYHDKDFGENWDVMFQASYLQMRELSHVVLFPPGAFNGAFPNGMIGAPEKWERHARLGAAAFYTGLDRHRVRLGAGLEDHQLYRVRERKNFTFTFVPGVGNVPTPLGGLVDVSATAPFMTPRTRRARYVYVQDEWNFAKDWHLTTGVRHDNYSDFGSTLNPRMAVVWEAAYNVTAKLLAGRAFRAPSFTELYSANNPVTTGNPNLRPERIETLETAVAWQPVSDMQLNLSLFRYRMQDIIRFVPNADPTSGSTAQNSGGQKGHGLELEAVWDFSRSLRFSGNYAYQRSKDERTGSEAGYAPQHQVYARADWRFAPSWRLHGQVNLVADRKREAGDPRSPVANYRTVDLTLHRGSGRSDQWEFSVGVRNLFNTDVREPSLAPGQIPNDLPMPGRSFYLQAVYRM